MARTDEDPELTPWGGGGVSGGRRTGSQATPGAHSKARVVWWMGQGWFL